MATYSWKSALQNHFPHTQCTWVSATFSYSQSTHCTEIKPHPFITFYFPWESFNSISTQNHLSFFSHTGPCHLELNTTRSSSTLRPCIWYPNRILKLSPKQFDFKLKAFIFTRFYSPTKLYSNLCYQNQYSARTSLGLRILIMIPLQWVLLKVLYTVWHFIILTLLQV